MTFLLLWVGLTLLQGKDYYLAPAYPMLLAAGAVAIEGGLAGKVWERAMAAAILVSLVAGGIHHGLPRAICGHNSYYLWGPGEGTGQILIAIDGRRADLEGLYDRVDVVARTPDNPYVMPDRADRPIHLCRRPRASLREVWPKFKNFW